MGLADGEFCTHLCATLPFLISEMIKGSPGFLLAAAKETHGQKTSVLSLLSRTGVVNGENQL